MRGNKNYAIAPSRMSIATDADNQFLTKVNIWSAEMSLQ